MRKTYVRVVVDNAGTESTWSLTSRHGVRVVGTVTTLTWYRRSQRPCRQRVGLVSDHADTVPAYRYLVNDYADTRFSRILANIFAIT